MQMILIVLENILKAFQHTFLTTEVCKKITYSYDHQIREDVNQSRNPMYHKWQFLGWGKYDVVTPGGRNKE